MADNKRKLIKADLENIKSTNSTFFTGVDDVYNLNFDPIVTGYAFIYWVSLPEWFEQDPDLKYFKQLTERNFRSFQGVNEITLNTQSFQTGFAGTEVEFASGISMNNQEFIIAHKDFSGTPMRKLYQKWVSYIRDPRSHIATYPKIFNVDYGAKNHTGQLLYIMVRPDVTNTSKDIVEFAALYSNVFPTVIPIGDYDYELGQQDTLITTIPFKGYMDIGPDVDAYAARILKNEIIKSSENEDGIPFIDSFNSDPSLSAGLQDGILKDIFNPEDEG